MKSLNIENDHLIIFENEMYHDFLDHEKYKNAADDLLFNIGSAASQDSDVESSKRRFLLHC